jgi:anti-anti-sigma factor
MRAEPELPCGALTVTMHADGGRLRLAVAGEIDMATEDAFRRGLAEAIAKKPTTIVVDLAEVTFMDSTGISALIRAHATFRHAGGVLSVVNCQRLVRRALEVTGVLDVLTGQP